MNLILFQFVEIVEFVEFDEFVEFVEHNGYNRYSSGDFHLVMWDMRLNWSMTSGINGLFSFKDDNLFLPNVIK